jgi:signal transduction histidine kinase
MELQKVVTSAARQRHRRYPQDMWGWIRRPRMLLWTVPVLTALGIGIPALALSVLQYRSLVELESQTQAAIRENLRQVVRGLRSEVAERIETVSTRALMRIEQTGGLPQDREQILSALRSVLDSYPEIDAAILLSACDCSPETFAAVASASGDRWLDGGQIGKDSVATKFLEAAGRARPDVLAGKNLNDLAYYQATCEECSPQPQDALYVLRGFAAGGPDGNRRPVAAVRFSQDGLIHFIQEVVSISTSEDSRPRFWVLRADGHAFFASDETPGDYEIRESFGEPLTSWELATALPGKTIEGIAKEQLRRNLLLTGLAILGLVAGLGLSVRAVARQAKLAEMKSAFVSNVSHEMRTPLSLIRLFAETLELGRISAPEKIQEYYRVIHRESRRLTQMINNVLDFSRIEAGHKDYQFTECDAGELVRNVLADYRDPIEKGGFMLQVDIPQDLPPLWADPNGLSQAILNLVDNAMKYSDETKEIRIELGIRGGTLAIQVRDRGIGIPRNELPKIFDTFHRVSTPLAPGPRGSGLGLTVTRHIVEAHGGQVEVDSTEGQGSCFTILLPVRKVPVENAPIAGGELAAESVDHRG